MNRALTISIADVPASRPFDNNYKVTYLLSLEQNQTPNLLRRRRGASFLACSLWPHPAKLFSITWQRVASDSSSVTVRFISTSLSMHVTRCNISREKLVSARFLPTESELLSIVIAG